MMKNSRGFLLFLTVATLSGCGLFGQVDSGVESSETISSQVETTSESQVNSSESEAVESESSAESEQSVENSESESESSSSTTEDEANAMTVEEVLVQVEADLGTEIEAKLPSDLPVSEGSYLTATTGHTDMGYEVVFYESDQQIPVNDISLVTQNVAADIIGRVTVEEYASQEESDSAISFTNHADQGGNEVDLGYGIIGYQDSGAGHTYTSWNEGRWDLGTSATTQSPEAGVDLAIEAVEFLEQNMLPAPDQYGSVRLSANNPGESALAWQEGTRVIRIDQVADPIQLLLLATYFA